MSDQYNYDRTASNRTAAGLSRAAKGILDDVKKAMQQADELGGADDSDEYADLMQAIADEALKRKKAALANK